jgi:hypothetical protein
MAYRKELTIYTLHRSHTYVQDRQFNGRHKRVNYLHTTEVIHTCRTDNSMADRKELTIYTLHRSHTYVQDRQFNGRQKRVNYLHTTEVIHTCRTDNSMADRTLFCRPLNCLSSTYLWLLCSVDR